MKRTVVVLLVCMFVLPLDWAQETRTTTETIEVPAGTSVPLTMKTAVKSRSTKPGDVVHAVIAFPVTVGDRVALPAGTLVEGSVLPPVPKKKMDVTRIIFNKLIFVNGYTVPLTARGRQALLHDFSRGRYVETEWNRAAQGAHYLDQCTPYPDCAVQHPPFDKHTGKKAAMIGGGAAVIGVVVYLLARHASAVSDDELLSEGAQFQMKLETPLTLSAEKIVEAIALGMPAQT